LGGAMVGGMLNLKVTILVILVMMAHHDQPK